MFLIFTYFCLILLFIYFYLHGKSIWDASWICLSSWQFMICCLSTWTSELVCHYPQNNLLGPLLTLHWIYRLRWKVLASWQYYVLLSVNMKYISIYLVIWFLFSVLYYYSYISCIYFIRCISKYFIWEKINVNGIVFVIASSTYSLLV